MFDFKINALHFNHIIFTVINITLNIKREMEK